MVSSTIPSLPPSSPNQTYVTVSPLEGGFITLPEKFFVSPADPNARKQVPSLSFLITHPGPPPPLLQPFSPATRKTPYRILFDLGLRRSASRYMPIQQVHLESRQPHRLEPGIAAQLVDGSLEPGAIDAVFLSHVHYDHHGDPEDFPASAFVVGHGALAVLEHGLPGKGSHQHFEKDLLPAGRTIELPAPPDPRASADDTHREQRSTSAEIRWAPLGPFPAALDLFGDGSVYVIDTPGHLPGHMNLLCRIGPEKWVCLAGDAFHDKRLLTGEKEIGTWAGEGGVELCIHVDKEMARQSIERLRELSTVEGVEIVAAHDVGWWERNKGKFFPRHL
ncbi:MAG: hypothetical protein M1821_009682 [Bathelium mastoideum]|nr:MAG: hypothetical protein M1821_009682 [Bathelium mastoideum]KAI9690560.1 MAG: hypothetical protein M1822_009523 [Bathelium mastoideum]